MKRLNAIKAVAVRQIGSAFGSFRIGPQGIDFREGDTRWLDGLRGMAAVLVIGNHVALSMFPAIMYPANAEARIASFWQQPFIMTAFTGYPWVACFLVLSAWVGALKPLTLVDDGRPEKAAISLAASCFRRIPRLVLPVTVSTTICWAMAHLNMFTIGPIAGNNWLDTTSPRPSATVWKSINDLFYSYYAPWADNTDYYERNLWCMGAFLYCSFTGYFTLLACLKFTTLGRRLIFLGLFAWGWRIRSDMIYMPAAIGLLLADIFLSLRKTDSVGIIRKFFGISFFIIGWYLISMPQIVPDWSPAYKWAFKTPISMIFPPGCSIYNYVCNVGMTLFLLGIIMVPFLQRFFTLPVFLWLGEISFPIYLVHGPILRSFAVWLLYLGTERTFQEDKDSAGNAIQTPLPLAPPSSLRLAMVLPVFFVSVIIAARIWARYIDTACNFLAKLIEDLLTGSKAIQVAMSVTPLLKEHNSMV